MNLKEKLEECKLSEDCFINTYITYDEKSYILEINYLEGRFVSEKTFPNNKSGVARMEEEKHVYRDENDVKRYFKLI